MTKKCGGPESPQLEYVSTISNRLEKDPMLCTPVARNENLFQFHERDLTRIKTLVEICWLQGTIFDKGLKLFLIEKKV